MARAKFASALLRVISAIFSLNERKPLPAVCELVSNVFHAFSLVAAKVSNARFVCSMLIFIKSRKASGTSGLVNASLAMVLSCPRNCPRLPGLFGHQQPCADRPPSSPPEALDHQV